MIDKDCLRFLKMLYKKGTISVEGAWAFLGHTDGSSRLCKPLSALSASSFIEIGQTHKEEDGEGGYNDAEYYYSITVQGRAYVEQKRREFWNFWIPYAITTGIALLSLFVALHNSAAGTVCGCCLA